MQEENIITKMNKKLKTVLAILGVLIIVSLLIFVILKNNPAEENKVEGKFSKGVLAINTKTGLLGTPILQGAFLTVETILEPRIKVGQLVEIESSYNTAFNGQYKVIGIRHIGVISEAVSGEAKTTLELLVGDRIINQLKKNG